jgi:hypothetical protein
MWNPNLRGSLRSRDAPPQGHVIRAVLEGVIYNSQHPAGNGVAIARPR